MYARGQRNAWSIARRAIRACTIMVAVSVVTTSTAVAAAEQVELAFGYNYLGSSEFLHAYGKGVFLGVGFSPVSRLVVVLEGAANAASDPEFDLHLKSLQIGPRLTVFPSKARVQTYLQLLGGVSRYRERLVGPVRLGWAEQDHLILQPAIGLDVEVWRYLALRGGVGISFIGFESTPCGSCEPNRDWQRELRVYVGLVVHTSRSR
jgi:hypothetical protein